MPRRAAAPAAQAELGFTDATPSPDLPAALPSAPRLLAWEPAAWPVAADWKPVVAQFLQTVSGQQLGKFIMQRLRTGHPPIYPAQPFRALELTSLADVKVVILGQDPYHGPGQAHGLAFSVPPGVTVPPSLRNIFKELGRDPALRLAQPENGSLERWARQGVLLLNTCLTVEESAAASHTRKGWEVLTDMLIETVASRPAPVVFMLWGAHAQAKRNLIPAGIHLVLAANHPSPLSALRLPLPFIGCGHFSVANTWLADHGQKAIRW